MPRFTAFPLLVISAAVLLAGIAQADNIQLVTGDKVQQIGNQPCVIGDPSCNNPQGTWKSFIDFEGTPGDFNIIINNKKAGYDFFSPVYVIGSSLATPNILPTAFNILIDLNTAGQQGSEFMVFFKSYICSGIPNPNDGGTSGDCALLDPNNSYLPGSATQMFANNNPGNGFSDMALTGFSFAPGTYVQFEARVLTDGAGMDQYFVQPTTAVPEPMSLMLLGTGLIGVAGTLRRKLIA